MSPAPYKTIADDDDEDDEADGFFSNGSSISVLRREVTIGCLISNTQTRTLLLPITCFDTVPGRGLLESLCSCDLLVLSSLQS